MIRKTSVAVLTRTSSVFNHQSIDEEVQIELTGNFEIDYAQVCRKLNSNPLRIRKLTSQLPPLPIPITPPNELSVLPHEPSPDGIEEPAKKIQDQNDHKKQPKSTHTSQYKFSPTMILHSENEDDDEITKVQIRGWKVPDSAIEAISICVPVCLSITSLVFWNCSLNETHFPLILSTLPSGNIRSLSIDQNPLIPEHLFGYLISEDSGLKMFNVRSNKIGYIGVRSIACALKSNKTLLHLSLWGNCIENDGAEILAESLRFNHTLIALSLGKNKIGDEGVSRIAKALASAPLLAEDQQAHKRIVAELEKQRREQEEDPILKKAKTKITASFNRNTSAPPRKSEENFLRNTTPIPNAPSKETAATPTANAKNAKGGNTKTGKPTTAVKKDEKFEKGKKKDPQTSSTANIEKEKGGMKKSATTQLSRIVKKGKVEEMREETEDAADAASTVEPMYENNGQWYVVGNRILNSLDLSHNKITEIGFKALLDVLVEQDTSLQSDSDGGVMGIWRILYQGNKIGSDNPILSQIHSLLQKKNPFELQTDSVEQTQ